MEEKQITQQYDEISKTYQQLAEHYHYYNDVWYENIVFDMKDKTLLDIGCGAGNDLKNYCERGAKCFGIDSSQEMIIKAKQKAEKAQIEIGNVEQMQFANDQFNIVTSKYVIQMSNNIPLVMKEIGRVLKKGGILMYLANHPLCQFYQKRKHPRDYFVQEIVVEKYFGGALTEKCPSHTLQEYLSIDFLQTFRILSFKEYEDYPSNERLEGDSYPHFFIMVAEKL